MTESSSMTFKCSNTSCDNAFTARIVEHRGGVNDYGYWIVKCKSCSEIFDIYVGRDVNDSSLTSGGEVLKTCDKDSYTEEDIVKEVERLRAV